MATKLFLHTALSDYGTGNNDAKLDGTASGWDNRRMDTSQGTTVFSLSNRSTVTGPTNGIEFPITSGVPTVWNSAPLNADITISGSITWNIWGQESNMSANVAINGRLEIIDGATGAITLIDQTARVTEAVVGVHSVNNFAETPAAGVACKRGDRLRVRIFADDAGTMSVGYTWGIAFDGPTGVEGDTWLTLTENLTFVSEPAGTTIYPTDTASDVTGALVEREAWTSRGAGVQTDTYRTVAGWTAPLQMTDTTAGGAVEWYTKPLTAFTLGGAVRVNVRNRGLSTPQAVIRCEIARVEGDGTGATIWGATTWGGTVAGATEVAHSFLVAGDDLAVSDGQRLRIRFYADDSSTAPMLATRDLELAYAGTSGGASGDTYLTFSQTLTEFATSTDRTGAATLTGGGVAVYTYSRTGGEMPVPWGRQPYRQIIPH